MDVDSMSAAVTDLVTQLSVTNFTNVMAMYLPIAGAAVLVGFGFYALRYFIGLFRGI